MQIQGRKPTRRTRAKFACPEPLAKLIRLSNQIKPHTEKTFADICKGKVPADVIGVELESYLFQGDYFQNGNRFAVERFNDLIANAKFIRHVAIFNRALPEARDLWTSGEESVRYEFLKLFLTVDLTDRSFVGYYGLNKKGYIERVLPEFTDIFAEGNKVAWSRIRVCPNCNNLFWAQTVRAAACSPECLNIERQSRYRARNKDKINEARRYAYKNRKRKERKRDGNL